MSKLLPLFFIMALLATQASAKEYYADVRFDITESGTVEISGISNHPQLSPKTTPYLTSKKGLYWILTINVTEPLSELVYQIDLPPNSEINFIKSSTKIRIGSSEGRTFVKGSGSNQSLNLMLEYSINAAPGKKGINWLWPAALIFALVAIAGIFLAKGLLPSKKNAGIHKELLTPRQRQIVEMLEKNGKPMTQKQIEEQMQIPKSSTSRNIETLVQKGIIKKESQGMTNVIYIPKTE